MDFLGVSASLTGRTWVGPSDNLLRAAEAMAQSTHLPHALCATLARLGVPDDQAKAYLSPQLRHLLPDPRSLRDMQKASARLITAINSKEKIAIFADYDVDGASSAALLCVWLRHFGCTPTLYVPDRIDEGYGPNVAAMQNLAADHSLIICVDCGTLSHEPIEASKPSDVIVLDHHLGAETLPDCHAVVNPNRQDETADLGYLCAAAVVFLCLVECRRQLRENGKDSPDLMSLLDLVALATVADVAPLVGVNRAFVHQGLKVIAQRARPGMVALADCAGVDSAPSSYHLGYVLGPRINAGGRIGQADLGVRLLTAGQLSEAQPLAERLDHLNVERRAIENQVQSAALEQAAERGFDAPLVWAAGEGWHPGVVGIVAARLKEASNRPAIVIGFDGNDGKGSGRSVSGIDLGVQIQKLAAEGLLQKGGGHKMAAGLSLTRDQLEPAMARLADLLKAQGSEALGPADLQLDAMLMPTAASIELIEQLDHAGPYGAGAPGPRFAFADMAIKFAQRVGESHLKLRFGSETGPQIDAICFGAFDGPIGPALQNHGGQRFHLAGRLEINTWRGRQSVQLRLEDAAPA